MPSWITAQSIRHAERCLHIGDFFYLPLPLTEKECRSVCRSLDVDSDLMAEISRNGASAGWGGFQPQNRVFLLAETALRRYENRGEWPAWLGRAPKLLGRAADIERVLRSVDTNPLAIVANFPYASVPYVVLEDGFVEQVVRTFGLFRLSNIAQLGFLHDPILTEKDGSPYMGTTFSHNRYHHVLNVAALMNLMAANNGLSPQDHAKAVFAGLTHDALTPAGGDSIKVIDQKAFDEDLNYPELLASKDWSVLRQAYNLDPEDMHLIIQGKGPIGAMLNLADKLSYVSYDAWVYVQRYGNRGPRPCSKGPEHVAIGRLVRKLGNFCDLWDCFRIVDGQGVVTDPLRLADFLELRALLFRQFYWHQGSRFLEFIVGTVLTAHLYRSGALSRQELLTMDDDELKHILEANFSIPFALWSAKTLGEPSVKVFKEEDMALEHESELRREGHDFVFFEKMPPRIKSSTHMLVQDRDGCIKPLSQASPNRARRIEEFCVLEHPYRVYCLRHPIRTPALVKAIEAYRTNREKRLSPPP